MAKKQILVIAFAIAGICYGTLQLVEPSSTASASFCCTYSQQCGGAAHCYCCGYACSKLNSCQCSIEDPC
jgi:hypothetical protein